MTSANTSGLAVTGVVLAGGQGSRLSGADKGLLTIADRRIVELVLDQLRPQVDTVIISANRNCDVYARYGYPVVADDHHGFQGPLAGVAAAMGCITTPLMLIVPCDNPILPANLATRLMARLLDSGADAAVAHDGERLQPVHALLRTGLLSRLHAYLATGGRRVDGWYHMLHMAPVDFSGERSAFRNVNTHNDLQAATEWLISRPGARERGN